MKSHDSETHEVISAQRSIDCVIQIALKRAFLSIEKQASIGIYNS